MSEMIGKRFGRLVVTGRNPNHNRYGILWDCACDCGNTSTVVSVSLNSKRSPTKSCGCLNIEVNTKHGHTKKSVGGRTHEYTCWHAIRKRCLNPKEVSYKAYGAKGITMLHEWIDNFKAFLDHIGLAPSIDHSVDRWPDKNGNYVPGNVRWATDKEQARNKNNNRIISANGEEKVLAEWSELTGIGESIIRGRLKRGWSENDAINTPTRPCKKYKPREPKVAV